MINLTLKELATELDLPIPSVNPSFEGISIDTRTLNKGNLYIALKGENFDGHHFVTQAGQLGASAALVEHNTDASLPQLLVKDTIAALGKIGANWRNRFSLPLIAVTGSNGKTTLKNMIASILTAECLGNAHQVFATAGNFNNHIGLPLTLCRLNENHKYGVLEMGMNHFNEIAYLTQLAKPHVAVINNAAAAHLEGVGGDIDGVAKAKGEIFLGLQKNGVAVLNKDDPFFKYWCSLVTDHKRISFGLNNSSDVTATIITQTANGQHILLQTPAGKMDVTLPFIGEHNVMNALAATAATLALNIDLHTIKIGLETVQAAPGRMNQHMLPNGLRVIDDTYNANPFSLDAALNALSIFAGKKILVLGDMKELGPDAQALHTQAGKNARAAGIDHLFTYGELSSATSSSFGEHAQHFTDHEKLLHALKPHLQSDATVLVKGSRSMKMENIVSGLIAKQPLIRN
ncbi:MAG: UDP-N-acetylmuramoyl-tripeptide--D-alanyl-D-alanine ligase [Gammaproteobacteria bacterium]|nr:UDP-N-acetylmuramoyl-tripeptide--D-alanyl-D-alanine ligase [Gammaproteobacteria bacterium]